MGEAEEVRELEIGNASINIMSNGVVQSFHGVALSKWSYNR